MRAMSSAEAPPIHLLDGHWYTQDPHRGFAWMRAHAPIHWDGRLEFAWKVQLTGADCRRMVQQSWFDNHVPEKSLIP